MKKVLAAALICAVSSFAAWDYFPVKEAGKGEAKAGIVYTMLGDNSIFGINAGARFSVIEGLEIAAIFNRLGTSGFPISMSFDGESCSDVYKAVFGNDDNCPPTMMQPILGLRYWLPMGLGLVLDVDLPFQGDAGEAMMRGTFLAFTPGVQYSAKFTEEFALGSQVSLYIPLEDSDTKFKPGMELGIGLEARYSLGMVVPFVGVDVLMQLTKEQIDGNDDYSPDTATGIVPSVGARFEISDMLLADVGVKFGIGEDYFIRFGEDMPISIGANFSVNF